MLDTWKCCGPREELFIKLGLRERRLIPRTGQRRARRHDLIRVANTYIAAHQVAEAHDEETR